MGAHIVILPKKVVFCHLNRSYHVCLVVPKQYFKIYQHSYVNLLISDSWKSLKYMRQKFLKSVNRTIKTSGIKVCLKRLLNDDISGWYRVTDSTLEELLQTGDRIEFAEQGYMHWGLYVGLQTNLGAGSSKEDVGNVVHLSKQKGGIRLEMLNTLDDGWARKNNYDDMKMKPLEQVVIVGKALNAVNVENIYSAPSANC